MNKNLTYIVVLICSINFLFGMEEQKSPNQYSSQSNKHLLIHKSLKNYLIAVIIEKKIFDLQTILNSKSLITDIKELLLSELAIKDPYITIGYLSKCCHEGRQNEVIEYFNMLNLPAKKNVSKKIILILLCIEKNSSAYFNLENSFDLTESQKNEILGLKDMLELLIDKNKDNLAFLNNLFWLIARFVELEPANPMDQTFPFNVKSFLIELKNTVEQRLIEPLNPIKPIVKNFAAEIIEIFNNIKAAIELNDDDKVSSISTILNKNEKEKVLEYFIYILLTINDFDLADKYYKKMIESNLLSCDIKFDHLLNVAINFCPDGARYSFGFDELPSFLPHPVARTFHCFYYNALDSFSKEVFHAVINSIIIELSLDEKEFEESIKVFIQFIDYIGQLNQDKKLQINTHKEIESFFKFLIKYMIGISNCLHAPQEEEENIMGSYWTSTGEFCTRLIKYLKENNIVDELCIIKLTGLCKTKLLQSRVSNCSTGISST